MYQSRLKNAKKRAQRQDRNRAIAEPEDGQDTRSLRACSATAA